MAALLRVCMPASTDRTARLWNLYTGKCDAVLRGHNGIVPCLAVAPAFPSTCVNPTVTPADSPGTSSVGASSSSPGLGWSEFQQQPPPQCSGASETSVVAATACGDGVCRLWKITMGGPTTGDDAPSVIGARRAAASAAAAVTCLQELKGWSEGGVNLVAFAFPRMPDSDEVNKVLVRSSLASAASLETN